MNSRDQIINEINQRLAHLRLGLQFEEVSKEGNNSRVLLSYEREDRRKYELSCTQGLALRRIQPHFI
jgi:hypothetical protein